MLLIVRYQVLDFNTSNVTVTPQERGAWHIHLLYFNTSNVTVTLEGGSRMG